VSLSSASTYLGKVVSVTSVDIEYFYREAEEANSVWTLRQDEGMLTVLDDDGSQVVPLWSTRERVVCFMANREDFEGFFPLEIPLNLLLRVWLPDLNRKKVNIGVNWSGKTNIGCEASAEEMTNKFKPGFFDSP
jgi:hypothetical protein